MNIAGPLAALIFGITVFTVFGGLFAYGVYKARERTRRKPAHSPGANGRKPLQFFIEYEVPIVRDAVHAAPGVAHGRRVAWGHWALAGITLVAFVTATTHYVRSGRRLVLQGGWMLGREGPSREFPAPPLLPKLERHGLPRIPSVSGRTASLVPRPSYDENKDERLSVLERARVHAEVPQHVLLVVDDNGHAQGMRWLYETFEKHNLRGKVTYFITGNYAEGKPSYLGGPINEWWSTLAREDWIGIHGLTHESSNIDWPQERWFDENVGVMREITNHVTPTLGSAWTGYPFGARAPYLACTDAYLSALDRIEPHILYDASMVVHPTGPASTKARDQSWPFSLDAPLPVDAELPFSEKLGRRVALNKHRILEVPVYAWAVSRSGRSSADMWMPSLDANYFDVYPCKGDVANAEGIRAFEENLKAHYDGNRAPFHIGLHAQNYMADRRCERASVEAMLAIIERLGSTENKVQFTSIPRFLEWFLSEAR